MKKIFLTTLFMLSLVGCGVLGGFSQGGDTLAGGSHGGSAQNGNGEGVGGNQNDDPQLLCYLVSRQANTFHVTCEMYGLVSGESVVWSLPIFTGASEDAIDCLSYEDSIYQNCTITVTSSNTRVNFGARIESEGSSRSFSEEMILH